MKFGMGWHIVKDIKKSYPCCRNFTWVEAGLIRFVLLVFWWSYVLVVSLTANCPKKHMDFKKLRTANCRKKHLSCKKFSKSMLWTARGLLFRQCQAELATPNIKNRWLKEGVFKKQIKKWKGHRRRCRIPRFGWSQLCIQGWCWYVHPDWGIFVHGSVEGWISVTRRSSWCGPKPRRCWGDQCFMA